MPKSFSQIAADHGGETVFLSAQDDISNFLSGPLITNYEGVCLALVMMWLAQDTSKKSPLSGTPNKVAALKMQSEMEAGWRGFNTVYDKGLHVVKKNFWWKSDIRESISASDPARYLLNDPQINRDGLHIFVLYPDAGTGHAIGVWRFPSGTLVLYDPNNGACAVRGGNFSGFLRDFIAQIYPNMTGYAVCSWCSNPPS
ncbi:hypothetical protein [Microbulbifer sp. SAOS-129_SWC]|uniref:hypothetical protein n=1 Tax=Microbulbifer sp. SAOS-129_SWC TaxID=3145235 RepID=UPI003217BBDC